MQNSVHVCVLSHFSFICLFATVGIAARQAPLLMGFSRQEYWSELPCPSPGYLPNSGVEPMSLISPSLAGGFFTTSATWEAKQSGSSKWLIPILISKTQAHTKEVKSIISASMTWLFWTLKFIHVVPLY